MKTFISIIVALFIITSSISAQTIDSTIHEIQTYWDDYYADLEQEMGTLEGTEYDKYQRWLWFWKSRVGEGGTLTEAYNAYNDFFYGTIQSFGSSNCNSSASWTSLGPSEMPTLDNYQGGIGVTNFMVFHPDYDGSTNETIFTISQGGLWKSNNDGGNWAKLETENINVEACSALGVGQQNADILYLGTGLHYSNIVSVFDDPYQSSLGIYKSTDGGVSWNYSGVTPTPWTFNSRRRISKIMVRPNSDDVVYSLVYYHSWAGGSHWEGDIYKTIDGGQNWSLMFHTNQGRLLDMEFHPTDPDTFYVSGQRLFRFIDTQANTATLTPDDITNNLGGYFEYNAAGTGHIANIQIAVTPANPDNVYAIAFGNCINSGNCQSLENTSRVGIQNLWISNNTGDGFTAINSDFPNVGYNTAVQGSFLLLCLDVSDVDEDIIYVGGVAATRSTDGGATFVSLSNFNDLHPDNRSMFVAPNDTNKIFTCNDACFYRSLNRGDTWEARCTGLDIGKSYGLGISNTPNQNDEDKSIAGFQDVTTNILDDNGWRQGGSVFGDGMLCFIDPNNDQIMYRSAQFGRISRSTNNGQTFTGISTGGNGGAWVTPYMLAPNNSNILYTGRRQLWRTDFGGTSQAIQISNFPNNRDISAIDISPADSNVIIVAKEINFADYSNIWGTSTLQVADVLFRTNDGGTNWIDITPSGQVGMGINAKITDILIHPERSNKIWITYSDYRDNTGTIKLVLVTDDGGTTWSNYSNGLFAIPVNSIAINPNRLEDEELYVGTDVGVFYKNRFMSSWDCFDDSLPIVPVTQLKVNPHLKVLRISTYGRGLWQTPLNCPTSVTEYTLPNSPIDHYIAKNITSTSDIGSTRNVGYRAQRSIELTSGFDTSLGAVFSAEIYSCDAFEAGIVDEQPDSKSTKNVPTVLPLQTRKAIETDFLIYPNITNDGIVKTKINIPQKSLVSLFVYNHNGILIRTITKKDALEKGISIKDVNVSNLPSGVYYFVLRTEKEQIARKFIKS